MSAKPAGQTSPTEAAAALRDILRLVEDGHLDATPGLQRLIQGAAIGLDQNASRSKGVQRRSRAERVNLKSGAGESEH